LPFQGVFGSGLKAQLNSAQWQNLGLMSAAKTVRPEGADYKNTFIIVILCINQTHPAQPIIQSFMPGRFVKD